MPEAGMIATSRSGTGTTMSTILPRAAADGPHPVDDQLPEEAARAAERDLRLILDNVPALVNTVTPTGAIDFANRRLLDYLGVGLEQLQDWPPFIHESDRSMVIERWKHSVESGQPFEAECRLRRADGVYRWFHGHAVPVRAQDGAIVRWYNLVTDIEDRKRAEDLLRSSERQLRAIVDNIPALIAIHSASGELELENRAAQEYHGRSPADIEAVAGQRRGASRRSAGAHRRTAARVDDGRAARIRAAPAARGRRVSMVPHAVPPVER